MITSSNNSWIICPRPNPQARLRLFCFPYAGGGASSFRSWPDDLPANIEVSPVQLPGRENRIGESLFTQLSPLIQTLAQVLRPYIDIPFAFFGHSLGALISFELVRQLRWQKSPMPMHLFISGRYAPQIPNPNPPIYQLPDILFAEELRWYNGTPEVVLQNPELMELFLPILRADFTINETYVYAPESPLSCPISTFGGLQDKEVSRSDLAAWREQTNGTFSLCMFPGDHFFLQKERYALLQAISDSLHRIIKGQRL